MTWYVYVLCDPDTMYPRYVGTTVSPLIKRLQSHVSESKADGPCRTKCVWVLGLLSSGKRPEIVAVETIDGPYDDRVALAREAYWIERCFAGGADLINERNVTSHAVDQYVKHRVLSETQVRGVAASIARRIGFTQSALVQIRKRKRGVGKRFLTAIASYWGLTDEELRDEAARWAASEGRATA